MYRPRRVASGERAPVVETDWGVLLPWIHGWCCRTEVEGRIASPVYFHTSMNGCITNSSRECAVLDTEFGWHMPQSSVISTARRAVTVRYSSFHAFQSKN